MSISKKTAKSTSKMRARMRSRMGFPEPLDYRIPCFQRISAGVQLLSEPHQMGMKGRPAVRRPAELQRDVWQWRARTELLATAIFTVINVAVSILFSLLLAILLNFKVRFKGLFPVLLLCADHHAVRCHGWLPG